MIFTEPFLNWMKSVLLNFLDFLYLYEGTDKDGIHIKEVKILLLTDDGKSVERNLDGLAFLVDYFMHSKRF